MPSGDGRAGKGYDVEFDTQVPPEKPPRLRAAIVRAHGVIQVMKTLEDELRRAERPSDAEETIKLVHAVWNRLLGTQDENHEALMDLIRVVVVAAEHQDKMLPEWGLSNAMLEAELAWYTERHPGFGSSLAGRREELRAVVKAWLGRPRKGDIGKWAAIRSLARKVGIPVSLKEDSVQREWQHWKRRFPTVALENAESIAWSAVTVPGTGWIGIKRMRRSPK